MRRESKRDTLESEKGTSQETEDVPRRKASDAPGRRDLSWFFLGLGRGGCAAVAVHFPIPQKSSPRSMMKSSTMAASSHSMTRWF